MKKILIMCIFESRTLQKFKNKIPINWQTLKETVCIQSPGILQRRKMKLRFANRQSVSCQLEMNNKMNSESGKDYVSLLVVVVVGGVK